MTKPESPYVSRAGKKLEHALHEFDIDVTGLVCADLGCNVGGFTDCLLQHGAVSVHAVDTAYGTLAWKLRQDDRVIVLERTNALHLEEMEDSLPLFDLITIDLGWTPQRLAVPAAAGVLKPGGRIISLIKSHYELSDEERAELLRAGALADDDSERIAERTIDRLRADGFAVHAMSQSPIRGGKSSRKRGSAGNAEYLALIVG